jgi:signal transduction histidine kinase
MDEKNINIDIVDTGAGMTADMLAKIFTPFYSATSGGVGLGMIIIKNIIDAHHGKVIVSSVPGSGTTVSISLPVLM